MFQTNFNEVNNLWGGKRCAVIYNPKANIGQIVLDALSRSPEKIVQVSDNNDIELSAEEIRLRAIRAAQRLNRLGYQTNDVIGFMTRNNHHVAPVYFAALCMGCPINALDPEYKQPEVVRMFGITKPKLVFCEQDCYDVVVKSLRELGNEARVYTLDGSQSNIGELFAETGSEGEYTATDVDAESHLGVIVCSSETAETAKGVSVSHSALMDMSTVDSVAENDVTFTSTTLFWLSGVYMLLSSTIFGAKRIITTQPFSPEYVFRIIPKYQVTRLHTATQLLPLVAKHEKVREAKLGSVKYYLVGGRNMETEVIQKMNNCLENGQLVIGYGITGVGFISLNRTKTTKSNDSCGSLKHNLEAKIVGENGNRLGVGEDGELCVKTPARLLGYFDNRAATRELFDNEGFVLTGDIAHFDKNGYLHIVDRKSSRSEAQSNGTSGAKRVQFDSSGTADSDSFWKGAFDGFDSDGFPIRRRRLLDDDSFFSRRMPMSPFAKDLRQRIREIVINFFD